MGFGFTRQDFKIGQQVSFGRSTGAQTLGKIVKLNFKRAKVKTLESRGVRDPNGGAEWSVPYSMIRPADPNAKPGAVIQVPKQPLTFSPFAREDNLILEAIVSCHSGLSPENLACDGEASVSHMRRVSADLNRKLHHLQLALGRQVSEDEAYEWSASKDEWDRARQKKA